MKTLVKIIILFFILSAVTTILFNYTDLHFGKIDYFTKHGWIFLFSIAIFPRLTLFISGFVLGSIEFGGFIWWLGFFFAPRILVAILATVSYWTTNPMLVVFAWLIALGGESSEKFAISRKMKNAPQKFSTFEGTTIEAEFKVKE
jgi:hypothetical protein